MTYPRIVLVHGAFADASSWSGVVRNLQDAGHQVTAPPNPLRGLARDSAYLAGYLKTIEGPVVLVGHSYGGEVITNAAEGLDHVKALVYVAAIAPDVQESADDILGLFPGSGLPDALAPVPYVTETGGEGVDLFIKPEAFRPVFAADVDPAGAAVLAAVQRPVEAASLSEASSGAAWKDIPSWYLVATQDRAIPAEAQRYLALRAGAFTVEVDASHAVAVSRPDEVADLILTAVKAVA
ncbi:alpha/beta fold hydrolase [Streptomyces sp. NBC_01264]|uniref:alpha/beta fold hydrolase n=1 Tax=Streptomyces sp. NBC_01264 TaxID=2903804 RepID=UPI00224E56D2|nr:alpha/beta hydrolase [Streptomyces sp. NBC_01264]MCX4781742.1 alpha/beta hydrolase [Streptomyces sp. NBC_01264]